MKSSPTVAGDRTPTDGVLPEELITPSSQKRKRSCSLSNDVLDLASEALQASCRSSCTLQRRAASRFGANARVVPSRDMLLLLDGFANATAPSSAAAASNDDVRLMGHQTVADRAQM